jgi:hypothetical protein
MESCDNDGRTGIMGMIQRREIDFSLMGNTMLPQRAQVQNIAYKGRESLLKWRATRCCLKEQGILTEMEDSELIQNLY